MVIRNSMFCGLLVSFLACTNYVGAADKSYAEFKDCLSVLNDEIRLVCYDTFAKGSVFNLKKEVKAAKDNFGQAESGLKVIKNEIDHITLKVIKVKRNPYGKVTVWTENNQIWTQNDSRTARLPRVPFNVTVKKGILGSFFMIVEGKGRSLKVKRRK